MVTNRRGYLRSAVALTGALGVAGCTGDSGGEPSSTETTATSTVADTDTVTASVTTTPESVAPIDHPSAKGLADEPTLGGKPWETEAAIIMFSDPSCPYCQKFHANTFAKLKQNLVEPGRVSYVFRTYPKVEEWGQRAIYALESVYRRDEELFWGLKEHYYDNPADAILTEDTTRTFLEENGDVDVDAVIEDMNQRTYSDAVLEDMDAAQEAEMTTIPSYTIVNDGEVRTTAHGVVSYENLKTMLGV